MIKMWKEELDLRWPEDHTPVLRLPSFGADDVLPWQLIARYNNYKLRHENYEPRDEKLRGASGGTSRYTVAP